MGGKRMGKAKEFELFISFCAIIQGPLKKWTEHAQELHLLKIHSKEQAPITTRGWMGVDFLDHDLL